MKIDNNQAYSNYSSLNNTNQSSDTKFFSSYLEESKEESKNEINTDKKIPAILDFLNKHNLFDNLSEEDEVLFRHILDDGIFSFEEMQKLEYSQMRRFQEFVSIKNLGIYSGAVFNPNNPNGEILENAPPILLGASWNAYKNFEPTDDENFNKAYYETYKNIDDDMERIRFGATVILKIEANKGANIDNLLISFINKYKELVKSKAFTSEEQRQMVQDMLDNFIKLNETFNKNKMN